MSLFGVMRTSISGMNAQATRLSAVSNNIANSNTVGYKESNIEFSTLVLSSGVSDYASGAVDTHAHNQISKQGALSYTSSSTDLALQGDGFFLVQGPGGQTLLTRAGSFVKDGAGDLVNAAGYKLLGYSVTGGGAGPVVNGPAGLVPVNLSSLALQATPSTSGVLTVNMPSSSTAVAAANLPSANSTNATYTDKSSMVVYDSLGKQVTLDVYSTDMGGGQWEVSVFDSSTAAAGGGFPYSSGPLSSTALTFDQTTGKISSSSASNGKLNFAIPNGAAFTLDMSQSTQLATGYSVVTANANGNAPAAVRSIQIASDGTVSAALANGSTVPAFQIPVARVISPDNLSPVSGTAFQLSQDSGAMVIGQANQDGNGSIISSALEGSTVDLGSQLTDMIQAQSSYTANSKVFQSGTELLTVLNNLHT